MHYNLQAGRVTCQCGPGVVPVSPSAQQERGKESRMPAISGPKCSGSLLNAALQSSLESRLRARMDVNGSPEYVLTWKHWDMESGPPICALRASVRRTSDKGFTGWPTPQVFDSQGGGMPRQPRYKGTAPSEQGNTRNPDKPGSYRADLKDIAGL